MINKLGKLHIIDSFKLFRFENSVKLLNESETNSYFISVYF